MSETVYSHKLMREKFIQRDDEAIKQLNSRNYGFGGPLRIEDRIYFLEDRVADLACVVVKLLEELDKAQEK